MFSLYGKMLVSRQYGKVVISVTIDALRKSTYCLDNRTARVCGVPR